MQATNVERILLWDQENGHVWTQEEFAARFGFEPDGGEFFFGVSRPAAERLLATGRVLDWKCCTPKPCSARACQRQSGNAFKGQVHTSGILPSVMG